MRGALTLPAGIACASLLVGVLIGAAAAPGRSRPASEDDAALLYELSGLKLQIEAFVSAPPPPPGGGRAAPELAEAMRRAAARPVDVAALHDNGVARLAERLDEAALGAGLAWFKSHAGTRIARAEIEASRPQALPAMIDYAARLASEPPPEARRDLVEQIARAADADSQARQMVLAFALTTALGMNAMLPREQRRPPGAVRRSVEAELEASSAALAPMVRLNLLYAYRGVSDLDLKAYLAFLDSEPGRRCTLALSHAALDTIGRFGFDLGRAVAEELAGSARARPL